MTSGLEVTDEVFRSPASIVFDQVTIGKLAWAGWRGIAGGEFGLPGEKLEPGRSGVPMIWSAAVAVIARRGCFGPACPAGTGSRHHGPFGINSWSERTVVSRSRGRYLRRRERGGRCAATYGGPLCVLRTSHACWFYGTLVHPLVGDARRARCFDHGLVTERSRAPVEPRRLTKGTAIMTVPVKADVSANTRKVLAALAQGDPDLLAAGLEVRAEWKARSGLDARSSARVGG